MATLARGYTFSTGDVVLRSLLAKLIEDATIDTKVVNADFDSDWLLAMKTETDMDDRALSVGSSNEFVGLRNVYTTSDDDAIEWGGINGRYETLVWSTTTDFVIGDVGKIESVATEGGVTLPLFEPFAAKSAHPAAVVTGLFQASGSFKMYKVATKGLVQANLAAITNNYWCRATSAGRYFEMSSSYGGPGSANWYHGRCHDTTGGSGVAWILLFGHPIPGA